MKGGLLQCFSLRDNKNFHNYLLRDNKDFSSRLHLILYLRKPLVMQIQAQSLLLHIRVISAILFSPPLASILLLLNHIF